MPKKKKLETFEEVMMAPWPEDFLDYDVSEEERLEFMLAWSERVWPRFGRKDVVNNTCPVKDAADEIWVRMMRYAKSYSYMELRPEDGALLPCDMCWMSGDVPARHVIWKHMAVLCDEHFRAYLRYNQMILTEHNELLTLKYARKLAAQGKSIGIQSRPRKQMSTLELDEYRLRQWEKEYL